MDLAVWVLVGLLPFACELLARRAGRGFPTAAGLIRLVQSRQAGRAFIAFGWLWLGWHLFVR